jgi:hypothetical protein
MLFLAAAIALQIGQTTTHPPADSVAPIAQQVPEFSAPPTLTALAGRVEQPVELGQVKWRRDFDAGLAESKRTGKPVLLLFQEVPG